MDKIRCTVLLLLAIGGTLFGFTQERSTVVNEVNIVNVESIDSDIDYQRVDKRDINEKRRNRGLVDRNNIFVNKGQWVTGLNASYSTHKNDNYEFLVVDGITSNGYNFEVTPFVTYAIAPNMSVGARFVYGRTLLSIDKANISFGDAESGIDVNINQFSALKHSYSMMAVWRQYILFGSNRRFALFNEVQLSGGGMESKFTLDSPVKGTFATGKNFSLGIAPGLTAFATEHVAFEVSVGVMGISYSTVNQVHNQVEVGSIKSSMMNLKVNLLSIGIGVAFYL